MAYKLCYQEMLIPAHLHFGIHIPIHVTPLLKNDTYGSSKRSPQNFLFISLTFSLREKKKAISVN